jgi:cellulose synthase operon protein YhjQ
MQEYKTMDSHGTDRIEDLEAADTPEDVAVLYSWANLHGAKYRDFSASRREYRAQLKHRAAEQGRESSADAHTESERRANEATSTVPASNPHASREVVDARQPSARIEEVAARTSADDRVEIARRAEIAAMAEAAARREEREIAEAHAAAQRQASHYADSEIRRKASAGPLPPQLPGGLSDSYSSSPAERISSQPVPSLEEVRPNRYRRADDRLSSAAPPQASARRPQGYHPEDASGVRQIYRGPEHEVPVDSLVQERERRSPQAYPAPEPRLGINSALESMYAQRPSSISYKVPSPNSGQRRTDQPYQPERRASRRELDEPSAAIHSDPWPAHPDAHAEPVADPGFAARSEDLADHAPPGIGSNSGSQFSQALTPPESPRGRRAQDDFDYKQAQPIAESPRRIPSEPRPESVDVPSPRPASTADAAGPAWLYAPAVPPPTPPKPIASQPPVQQSSVADTLQHSRERVASRWFALKGVFEQPGQEQADPAPVRQKETRTPILAVFSLAGGVGKTSLIATVGRSLSSLGEKVLLTDTTSHGLLPFYFGASELRQGTVRTFSPPSGSTDAPIYLVSHEVEQQGSDEAAQERLVEEIVNNSRGTHRILLDLTTSSSWIVRRMARMNPTILVPVAPDMNSVISLQNLERYFQGVTDGDGRPLQPFYVINQFDTSLPLHLDVREVLRRQLGDRLLPFVIRRSPSVSEALAEGMTVVDYAPDAPIAEDYLNLATWLRTIAAPATAGFRNVRWSER